MREYVHPLNLQQHSGCYKKTSTNRISNSTFDATPRQSVSENSTCLKQLLYKRRLMKITDSRPLRNSANGLYEFKFTGCRWIEAVPESTYWPSGVNVASVVAFGEESMLNPPFWNRVTNSKHFKTSANFPKVINSLQQHSHNKWSAVKCSFQNRTDLLSMISIKDIHMVVCCCQEHWFTIVTELNITNLSGITTN